MKRTFVFAGLLAALCLAVAGIAYAKGLHNLTLKTAKGPIAANQQIKAESTNLIFETSAGNLECSTNVIEGPAGTNGTKKDTGQITAEKSSGGEPGGLCKTTTPFGAAEIAVANLPWSDVFTAKGANEAKGKKISFTSTFPSAAGAKCTFETAKVKSTFTVGGPVVIHTVKQKFKTNKSASNPQCPKEGTLTGDWAVTSNGEVVEGELTE
jgi:hypothetical protein